MFIAVGFGGFLRVFLAHIVYAYVECLFGL